MVVYGLEGVHYEKVDDTHITTLEYDSTQGGVDTSYAAMKWIMGNTFNAYLNQGCSERENELAMEINESADNTISDIMGFRIDISAVETQLSQISAVKAEYSSALAYGVMGVDGWEAYFDEFVQKIETAGLQTVLDEFQSQLDAFYAAK